MFTLFFLKNTMIKTLAKVWRTEVSKHHLCTEVRALIPPFTWAQTF